jgi:hypothetical protein
VRGSLVAVLAALALLFGSAPARAAFGFAPGSPTIDILDAAGNPYALAGGHPDRLDLKLVFNSNEDEVEGNVKQMAFDFPTGFSGDPNAVPACPRRVFDRIPFDQARCDLSAQVGVVKIKAKTESGGEELGSAEIFNIEPAPGELGGFGFSLLGKGLLTMHLRPDDFGVTIDQTNANQGFAVVALEVELWGVPADHQTAETRSHRYGECRYRCAAVGL